MRLQVSKEIITPNAFPENLLISILILGKPFSALFTGADILSELEQSVRLTMTFLQFVS